MQISKCPWWKLHKYEPRVKKEFMVGTEKRIYFESKCMNCDHKKNTEWYKPVFEELMDKNEKTKMET